MCLLSNVPGLADQLVASQEDSVRKRGNWLFGGFGVKIVPDENFALEFVFSKNTFSV
jgi:hypothetical protein